MTVNHFFPEVPDPTDFPADPPGLRNLDSALRCTICGELFDGPVTLTCGHCFCSCCVRAALITKQECPRCRKVSNEGHIRPNPVMEEAVLAWKGARAQILGLIKERDKARAEDEETTERPHKRLKRSREGETMIVEDSDTEWMVGPSSLRLGSVSPQKAKLKPTKLKPVPTPIPSSDVEESGDDIRTRQDNGSDVDVQCPLCQKDVKMSKINAHMDSNCQDVSEESRSQKHQWAQILGKHDRSKKGKDRESNNNNDRLPKVSYSTLKDRQLRDMLQEHELPTTGDRPTHERRHQHWVMLYNANLDRSISNRKSLQELRRELKQWEQQRTNRKKVQPPGDLKAYEKSHQAEFARLTEAARPKTKQNSVTPGSVTADPSQLDRDGPAPST